MLQVRPALNRGHTVALALHRTGELLWRCGLPRGTITPRYEICGDKFVPIGNLCEVLRQPFAFCLRQILAVVRHHTALSVGEERLRWHRANLSLLPHPLG